MFNLTMTTDTTTDITITIKLEEDPEIAYFTWRIQVEDMVSNAATVVVPTGLLPLVMKDPHGQRIPLTELLPQGGPLLSPHDL